MKFREHLLPPIGWFLIAGLFVLSTAGVFLIWLGEWWAMGVFVGLTLLIGGWFVTQSRQVVVDEDGLSAGGAHLEWEYLAAATALDRADTDALLGPGADASAWTVVPPYTRRAVRVDLDDPADPHPYWLIGTRRPEELAHALTREENR